MSVEQGTLFLEPSSACSDGPLSGTLLVFRDSLGSLNEALATLVYKVSIKKLPGEDVYMLFLPMQCG